MARFIYLLPAMMLVGFCVSCGQTKHEISTAPPPPKPLACSPPQLQVLKSGFYPPGDPTPDPSNPPPPPPPGIQNDVDTAISYAPPGVLSDLCKLDGIYIDPSGCTGGDVKQCTSTPVSTNTASYSWGFRYQDSTTNTTKMYIAIPGTLWAGGATQTLSTYENGVLNDFVTRTQNSVWGTSSAPVPTFSAKPDALWGAVLAALAHELGHVKFTRAIHPKDATGKETYGKNFDLTPLTSCSIGTTNIDFFDGWTYKKNPKKLFPQDRNGKDWRVFAEQINYDGTSTPSKKAVDHHSAPFLFPNSVGPDFYSSATPNTLLYELYSGMDPTGTVQYYSGWASYWGAWSPDEDFVETYVLYALSTNVKSLVITINVNGTLMDYDIIQKYPGKSILAEKVSCVENL